MKWPSWWPWLPPSSGDVAAIVIALFFAVCLVAGVMIGPRYEETWSPAGFGPDWRCIDLPESDPICVKKN